MNEDFEFFYCVGNWQKTKKKLISGLDCGDGNDERKITKKGIVDCLFLYIVPRKQ